jgi:PhzF family phenazine biosynthesis protein
VTAVLRYAAFSTDPAGGNPAGVVLDADLADAGAMQRIAADVGYSETAFLAASAPGRYAVRYFSPVAEVPFCGHATIASAVALAERAGQADGERSLVFDTAAGEVEVLTAVDGGGLVATLTSVPAAVSDVADADLAEALAALRWSRDDLDEALPPRIAFAGAHHLVLAAATRARLADLDYDVDRLAALMRARDWTTVHLVRRLGPAVFAARDPFPVGGVVEDPATGAAAAAFGAYLRSLGAVTPPARVTIHQGEDLGRPSTLQVDLVPGDDRVRVTGHAVPMEGPPVSPDSTPRPAPGSRPASP